MDVTGSELAEVCQQSHGSVMGRNTKMTCASVLTTQEKPRANRYSDEVHLVMWGPLPVKTLGGKSYYVTFTDDHSCKTHLELLSHKSDIFEAYKVYEAKLKPQKQINIKAL